MRTSSTTSKAIVALGSASLVVVVACSSRFGEAEPPVGLPGRDPSSGDAAQTTEDPTDPADGATEDGPDSSFELDAGDAARDAGTDAQVGPCTGKPNGFAYKPGDEQARCCDGAPARLDSTSSCGGCGIKCAGTACGELVPGHYACKCSANAQCVGEGYGSVSTCYVGGGAYCNCQCPSGAATCAGQCKGGAVCHVVSGNNYCGY